MKKWITTILMIAFVISMTACEKEEGKVVIKEPGKTITVIEDTPKEEEKPKVSVDKIDRYEKVSITDWLDENTVILSKDNETLSKISMAELSENYPMSLYKFDLTTKEYELVKEQEEVFLGGAVFSKDKKFLLYSEYSLGDPSFFIMNMDTMEGFGIMGDPIGGAMSAKWAGDDVVLGAAYSGGAYTADSTGKIEVVEGLEEESLYLVEKIGNSVYYNTQYDSTLMKFDLNTKEKVGLNLGQVYNLEPSPDGKQLLILQAEGTKNTLLIYDIESGEKVIVAEGTAFTGVSWSPDQRRIAYNRMEDKNNTTISSLYVYDILTGEPTQIAVDIDILSTSWSPSGTKLACMEYDGSQYISSIIYLK